MTSSNSGKETDVIDSGCYYDERPKGRRIKPYFDLKSLMKEADGLLAISVAPIKTAKRRKREK